MSIYVYILYKYVSLFSALCSLCKEKFTHIKNSKLALLYIKPY